VRHLIESGSRWLAQLLEPRTFAVSAALALVYFAAGRVGLLFAMVHPNATPVWPASGVALAAVLIFGNRVWPGIALGAFLVNLSISGGFLVPLGIAIGNTLEGVVGAYLVERFNGARRTFDHPADVWRFFALAGLIATTIAATLGVLWLYLAGSAAPAQAGTIWVTWWLGDAVGIMIVTPLILLWANEPRVRWTRQQVAEAILLILAIAVVGRALFGGWVPRHLANYPLDFVCIPMLVWVAFRFGQREAVTAVVILSGFALTGTLAGVGPFSAGSPSDSLLLLQTFLGLTAVMTLALAALVADSRRGHEATARVASIFKTSYDAIVTKTLDGTVTSWNPAAEKLFGYTADEAVGRNITFVIPKAHQYEESMVLAKIRRGEVVDSYETIRMRKDGTTFHASLTISPVRAADGTIVGASKVARDIDDRMRLDEERKAILAREQAARADAEAGNRAKDEFLAILSHELRTPLNAVYGWARMMQTAKLDEETSARALDAIVRNANAQVQLIDDLLDVSRVINGKMRLEVRPVDVQEVIDAALDAVVSAAETKGVELTRVIDPRGAVVDADPGRLQQVVWNLAMNAVKFTPSGGRVQVLLRRDNGRVELEVSDTGQGIPAHVLPYVFDRFRQWDSSSTRAHSGLGLGLALVKHLTELHRGTVSAESPGEGKGATFRVVLPLAVETRLFPTPSPAAPGITLGAPVRLDGLRILAVDDDADALELAATILSDGGATVKTCRSALAAYALLQEWRPDILVSDIDMPGEDGYTLIRKVRALDEAQGGKTPAVALTAYGRIEDRVQTLSSGYSMHIPKPVDPEEFTTIIASVARVLRTPNRPG
jgi:PAS domain S-box-containing protein